MISRIKILTPIFLMFLIFFLQNSFLKKDVESNSNNKLLKRILILDSRNQKKRDSLKIRVTSQKKVSSLWKTYYHKYGFEIALPNYFTDGSLTASGLQYYRCQLNDNITVCVESISDGSSLLLVNDYQSVINSNRFIDYKILRDDWYVVSGKDQDGIYYLKSIFKNGHIFSLRINYPVSQKDIFDSILPRISKSFK